MCKSMSGTPGNFSCIMRMQDLTLPAFKPVNVCQWKSDTTFFARKLPQHTHSDALTSCPLHCALSIPLYPQSFWLYHSVWVFFVYPFMICLFGWIWPLWPCGKSCFVVAMNDSFVHFCWLRVFWGNDQCNSKQEKRQIENSVHPMAVIVI